VYDVIAEQWRRASDRLRGDEEAARLFLPGGRAPVAGAVQRQPELAATLRHIARDGARGFYEGSIAAAIVEHLRALGGFHTLEDFATHAGTETVPVSGDYRGYRLYECPPNGQGITALLILGMLRGFDLGKLEPFGADRIHLLLEAGRQAISDRDRFIGDPAAEGWRELLDDDRLARLAAGFDLRRAAAASPSSVVFDRRHTSHVAVVDRDLNAVSLIASVFQDFGSGLVAPGTGVLLQNRGHSFVLTPGHPNEIGPGKRPLHTIIPALLGHRGRVSHVLGVVGGHFQAWGHAQLVSNLIDLGLDPQSALDAPRFWHNGRSVEVERGIDTQVSAALARRGHSILRHDDPAASWPLGGGQLIAIDRATGTLIGAADPRLDGCALGY
jgi:gamma-glutamyltranspeptidase/glutathione hydrolase